MLKILNTENMPWQKLYEIDETGTEMAVHAIPVDRIGELKNIVTCEECDVWKCVPYLNGFGICRRTNTLESKNHFCRAGQIPLTFGGEDGNEQH